MLPMVLAMPTIPLMMGNVCSTLQLADEDHDSDNYLTDDKHLKKQTTSEAIGFGAPCRLTPSDWRQDWQHDRGSQT